MAAGLPYTEMRRWAKAEWEDRPALDQSHASLDTAASPGSIPLVGPMVELEAKRWTDVLGRSRLSPAVFTVKDPCRRRVRQALRSTGLPTLKWVSLFDSLYRSTPLLDGLVLEIEVYGFPIGLPSGTRVVGFRTMRAVSLLLGVKAPVRRLKGEDRISTAGELLQAIRSQAAAPSETLRLIAELGLGIDDAPKLRALVGDLWPGLPMSS